MTLINKIKENQLIARKARDPIISTLLTTLLGEASMPGKNDGNRDSTDAEVVKVIKKFIKNAKETNLVFPNKALSLEILILTEYLPKQLTERELYSIIPNLDIETISVPNVMKALNAKYSGLFDSKVAVEIVRKIGRT